MSIVPVHGPVTWGQPFYAVNDDIAINLLGPLDLEFKALTRSGLLGEDPYTWDFGDGSPELDNGYKVRHIYASAGTKTVTVQINTTEGVKTGSITFTLDGVTREPTTEEVQLGKDTRAA
jgi:PKD domain